MATSGRDDPDVAALARIDAIAALLRVVCQVTGMGFAAVARVSETEWMACAVDDRIAVGLRPGDRLEVATTVCLAAKHARAPVVVNHASAHPTYGQHPMASRYGMESYISVPIVMPDGAYFGNLCALDVKPATLSQPHIVAMFELFADLIARHLADDRKRLDLENALAVEKAQGLLREEFIAVLGHDLRNPLSAISHSAALLQSRSDRADVVLAAAQRIARSAGRMSALLEDVIDLARGAHNGFHVQKRSVPDLGDDLQDIAAEMRAIYPSRTIETAIDIRLAVHCDRGRIQQLASNLTANALTHGAREGIVRVRADVADGSLVIAVANAGAPIPRANLEKIFTPFWRSAAADPMGGLGLGLYICDQIVRGHGGTLGVHSTAEDGTTFTARIPVREAARDAATGP